MKHARTQMVLDAIFSKAKTLRGHFAGNTASTPTYTYHGRYQNFHEMGKELKRVGVEEKEIPALLSKVQRSVRDAINAHIQSQKLDIPTLTPINLEMDGIFGIRKLKQEEYAELLREIDISPARKVLEKALRDGAFDKRKDWTKRERSPLINGSKPAKRPYEAPRPTEM